MRPTYILLLVGLAVVLGVLVSLAVQTDDYKTFEEAWAEEGEKVTVIGDLVRTNEIVAKGQLTEFYVKDENGDVKKVIANQPKPQDFERTEGITITGYAKGDVFHCEEFLLKCPSKYKDQEKNTAMQPQ